MKEILDNIWNVPAEEITSILKMLGGIALVMIIVSVIVQLLFMWWVARK